MLLRTENWELANDQHFANIVLAEEELQTRVVVEQVLDVAVIENALQPECGSLMEFQRLRVLHVVTVIRSIWPRIFRVEETQQQTLRLCDTMDPFDERLHQLLWQVVANVPQENGVKRFSFLREAEVEKLRDVNLRLAFLLARNDQALLVRFRDHVLVVNAVAELRDVLDVGGRRRAEIKDRLPFRFLDRFCKLVKTRGATRNASARSFRTIRSRSTFSAKDLVEEAQSNILQ